MSKSVSANAYPCLRLEPELWRQAPARFLLDVATGEEPEFRTRVRLFWSDLSLHVRVEVEDDHVVSPYQERDDPVYLADAIEVFLDPSGLGRTYFEIDLSPNNVLFDALVVNRQRTADCARDITTLESWNCEGLETRAIRQPAGWRAEIDIPMASLAPPVLPAEAAGEPVSWRFNVYRVNVTASNAVQYQALHPTGRIDFHRPRSFGELTFVAADGEDARGIGS